MTTSIDNKVVEMAFDNSQFTKGVDGTLKSVDNLKKGLNFKDTVNSLDGITRAAQKVSLAPIAKSLESVKVGFSALNVVAASVINNLTNRLVNFATAIGKTFTLDPIFTGFAEYELKLNSVQTIMAGTGESLAVVTDYLNELNTYADKTIYSFSDMTQNIGKFTNAGVSLDQSVNAIKGIANAAALSGANSNEASRAMYNFAQALSAGYVKLIDWKSIELANMGTVEFKQQIIDSAVALGTLKKEADGTYKTMAGSALSATKNFNESLTDQWLTTDVLVDTLNRYSDATTDIGKRATAAAQDVKSFTQLNDTLKEAAQSGWAQTWELILGNFDEAKVFFTKLSDFFGGIIGASADSRNAIVSDWKELGGRTALLDGIVSALEGIMVVIKPIGDAFREIFPPITAQRLYEITLAFQKFAEQFKMGGKRLENVKRIFKGLFAIIDVGRMFFQAIGETIFGFLHRLKPLTDSLSSSALAAADWAVSFRETVIKTDMFRVGIKNLIREIRILIVAAKIFFTNLVENFKKLTSKINFKPLTDFFENLRGWFSGISISIQPLTFLKDMFVGMVGLLTKLVVGLAPWLLKFSVVAGNAISSFFTWIGSALGEFDPERLFTLINTGLFGGILLAVRNFISEGAGMFENIADILDTVKDSLVAWQQNLQASALLKLAGAIGILAVSLLIIATIDEDKLVGALAAMTTMFVELFAAMKAFSSGSTGISGFTTMAIGLIGISTAMLILSVAIKNLGELDSGALIRAVVSLIGMIAALRKMAVLLSESSPQMLTGAIALSIFSVALLIMTKAVTALGSIQTGILSQGLIGVAILLAQMVIFVKAMNGAGGTDLIATAIGIAILSGALLLLTGAVTALGFLPLKVLQQGLIGMGAALVIIAGAMRLMPPDMILVGAGLAVVAAALIGIGIAMKIIGSLSVEQLIVALAGMSITLGVLAIAMSIMQSSIGGAAALIIAAGALTILAVALRLLGQMSLEEIGLALLAMASTFVVLGLAASILTPLLPSLLGLAAALLLIGVAALATGVGVLALSIGLTSLAAAGSAGAAALVLIISSIISLLPIIAQQLGNAIISLITTLAEGAPLLLDGIITLLLMIVEGLVTIIPQVVEGVLLLVTSLLTELAKALPAIVQAGYDILLALLHGVADNIGEIVTTSYDIAIAFITALGDKLPEVIQAGYDFVIKFIDGLAEAIEKNASRLTESAINLGFSMVRGVLTGLLSARSEILDGMKQLALDVLNEFKSTLGIQSPSVEMFKAASYIAEGLVNGILAGKQRTRDAAKELGNSVIGGMNDATKAISDSMDSVFDYKPMISPVVDLSNIEAASTNMQSIFDKPIGLGVAIDAVRGIVANNADAGETDANKEVRNSTVQFVQNNYSPKELSRIDIYRQTRNQLQQLRGSVGDA